MARDFGISADWIWPQLHSKELLAQPAKSNSPLLLSSPSCLGWLIPEAGTGEFPGAALAAPSG